MEEFVERSQRTTWKKHPNDYIPPHTQNERRERWTERMVSRSVNYQANKVRGFRRVWDRASHHSRRNQIRDQQAHNTLDGTESIAGVSSSKQRHGTTHSNPCHWSKFIKL